MKYERCGDDSELIEGCISRDLAAWSGFVAKYSGLLSLSIVNRLRKYGLHLPGEDIEDIKQDLLASLWKDEKLKDVRNRQNISYWLAMVAGNTAITYLRKKHAVFEPRTVSISENFDEKSLEELIGSGLPCPSEELAGKELAERIESEIDALPAKEKLVIKLSILYGKKHDEIADILNMPSGTVSSRIKRAKEKLRKKLQEFY